MLKAPKEYEINEKLRARFGRTAPEMLRDRTHNIGPAFEYLKRAYSPLTRREYGRALALVSRMLFR